MQLYIKNKFVNKIIFIEHYEYWSRLVLLVTLARVLVVLEVSF